MIRLLVGDCRAVLRTLPDESVHCVVTSPPYFGLRDYGTDRQIGLEPTPDDFVAEMVAVFREVRRVMRPDATLWLNLGDSYNSGGGYAPNAPSNVNGSKGLKHKNILGIPWRVAFALQADGWWLRQDIIWAKPNPMPESVRDRCTKSHEYMFLLSKSARYHFDAEAIAEPWESGRDDMRKHGVRTGQAYIQRGATMDNSDKGPRKAERDQHDYKGTRNKRSVWTVATQPFKEAHFATFPPDLIEPCILAGTSEKGCCAKCGAPWMRQTEKTRTFESGSGRSGNMPVGKNGPSLQGGGETLDIRMGPVVHTTTTGFAPSCACGADTVPCTVLDPFGGAGTTGLVADRLGRDAILIELNPAYASMAEHRIHSDAGLFAVIQSGRQARPSEPAPSGESDRADRTDEP